MKDYEIGSVVTYNMRSGDYFKVIDNQGDSYILEHLDPENRNKTIEVLKKSLKILFKIENRSGEYDAMIDPPAPKTYYLEDAYLEDAYLEDDDEKIRIKSYSDRHNGVLFAKDYDGYYYHLNSVNDIKYFENGNVE